MTLHFPSQLFTTTSVKKAAYRLSDRLTFDFSVRPEGVEVTLHPLKQMDLTQLERLGNRFKTEVLDNDLREQIGEETAQIRTAVLAYAFSKTGLQDNQ